MHSSPFRRTLECALRVRSLLLLVACGGIIAALPQSGSAQAPERYRVQRLTGPIQLDGRSDEPAWQVIEPLPSVGSFPVLGAQPSERTEFRLAYDDDYLYVSARNFDGDRRGIRATSLKRDDGSFSNDWFAINLDTFLDRETTLVLGVTPANTRTDVVFSGDGASNNFNWNTYWDARTIIAEDGWHHRAAAGSADVERCALRRRVRTVQQRDRRRGTQRTNSLERQGGERPVHRLQPGAECRPLRLRSRSSSD